MKNTKTKEMTIEFLAESTHDKLDRSNRFRAVHINGKNVGKLKLIASTEDKGGANLYLIGDLLLNGIQVTVSRRMVKYPEGDYRRQFGWGYGHDSSHRGNFMAAPLPQGVVTLLGKIGEAAGNHFDGNQYWQKDVRDREAAQVVQRAREDLRRAREALEKAETTALKATQDFMDRGFYDATPETIRKIIGE